MSKQEDSVVHLDGYYTVAGKVYEPGTYTIDDPQTLRWLRHGVRQKSENERIARETDEARIKASQSVATQMASIPSVSENQGGLDAQTVQQMIADAIAADRASRDAQSNMPLTDENQNLDADEVATRPSRAIQTQ